MNIQKSFYLLTIMVLCGFLMSACSHTKTGKKNDIRFTSIQKKEQYHLLGDTANPACNLEINFSYPSKYSDPKVLALLQENFILSYFGEKYQKMTPQEAVDKYTADYLANYKDLEKDYVSDLKNEENAPVGAWYGYFEISSDKVTFNKNDIVSYTVSYNYYTGGAHGAHTYMNHVLYLKTGKTLSEEDIFNDDYKEKLSKLIVDKIAKQNNVADPKELENVGYFSIDEIEPNGNFTVDGNGLTYIYNEYEIAAYVIGAIKVHFTFEELNTLLKKESPISSLFS